MDPSWFLDSQEEEEEVPEEELLRRGRELLSEEEKLCGELRGQHSEKEQEDGDHELREQQ
jgi:hypothetical protein